MTQPASNIPQADAAKLIADLAQKSVGVRAFGIATVGLGPGLPEIVPAILDSSNNPRHLKEIIEAHRLSPERRQGTARVETLASFVDLTKRHQDADSVIFGETAFPHVKLTAVLDYHRQEAQKHEARWAQHRIVYEFPLTDEFKAWMQQNSQPMEQADFAAFLEDHAAELASATDADRNLYEPLFKESFANPAQLITLSRELEVFVGAKVKRAERLQSGERVATFETEHTNGKGEPVTIPGIFMVSVPAWINGDPVRIPARLRYRLAGGAIMWAYHLYKPEYWLRCQVIDDMNHAQKETGLPAYLGKPEQ